MEFLYVSFDNDVACLDGLELSSNHSCSYLGNSCVAISRKLWHSSYFCGHCSSLLLQLLLPTIGKYLILLPTQYECGGIRRAPCSSPLLEDTMLIFLLNENFVRKRGFYREDEHI